MDQPVSERVFEDRNDNDCYLCKLGGDILCCDCCPSSFHKECLGIEEPQSDNWYCHWCCCKFCGEFEQREITNNPKYGLLLVSCRSCRRNYHRACVDNIGYETDHFNGAFICGKKCQEIYERLEMLLSEKHQIGDNFECNFLNISHDTGSSASKLDGALSILQGYFGQPIINHGDRNIDLIRSIVFSQWSNSHYYNYDGFLTVTLEKGDEIICVANIRVHENQIAEMPYIATHNAYTSQGMCRRLFDAIEAALSYLNVEMLIIPSLDEVARFWVSSFQFEPIDEATKILMKERVVPFNDVTMLQKKILKHTLSSENLSFIEVFNFVKNQKANEIKQVDHKIIAKGRGGNSSRRRGFPSEVGISEVCSEAPSEPPSESPSGLPSEPPSGPPSESKSPSESESPSESDSPSESGSPSESPSRILTSELD
ncbi:Acyl-CoA N-acyltransferase with RING/FYVE/PHD-type zinc finger protein [Trifolium repens]|nr:Acyl-CoA N-acyltransferase with RING/FYVE/PHD-type zinc finger protein [Trifolium repens]